TALSYASVNGFTKVVAALSALPATDLNLADSEGNTPLHLAAQAGHPDVVSHLVNKCGGQVELDPRNSVGFTPLMKAALQGRTKIAKTLLFAGASPHLRDFGRGLSATEWARYTGRQLCCDLIESVERSCSDSVREKWSSDPDLNTSSTSASADNRNNWLRHKFKKAFNNKPEPRKGHSEFRVVTNIPHLAKCATSPLLPANAAASVAAAAAARINVIPSLQVTEVKVADCYQDPEETLKNISLTSPGSVTSSSASSSSKNATVVGSPPTSKYVRRDTPSPTQHPTRKENSNQNSFKNEAQIPSSISTKLSEVAASTENKFSESKFSASSRSVELDGQEGKNSHNFSGEKRRTSSFSSPNSTAKNKSFGSGSIVSKPGVSQSIMTQTSGGRVVTGSVYSKTASVYTIQKSASATKFCSSGSTKSATTAPSADNTSFRSSSVDLSLSRPPTGDTSVPLRQRESVTGGRLRNSADYATKK
ncbi:Ankyrin repeat-containing domain, partial [Trinorchestia longiramus]